MSFRCQPGKASPIVFMNEEILHGETKSVSNISNNAPESSSSQSMIDEAPVYERHPRGFRRAAADRFRRLRNLRAKFSNYDADPSEDTDDEVVSHDGYPGDEYEYDDYGYDNTGYERDPYRHGIYNTYNLLDYSRHGYQPTAISMPVRFPLRVSMPVPVTFIQRGVRGTLYPFSKNVEHEIELMKNEREWAVQGGERSKASFDGWIMGNIEAEIKDVKTRLQELDQITAVLMKLQGEAQEREDTEGSNVDEGVGEENKETEVKETQVEAKLPETGAPA